MILFVDQNIDCAFLVNFDNYNLLFSTNVPLQYCVLMTSRTHQKPLQRAKM